MVYKGNKVVLVEMLPTVAADMEPFNRQGLLEALGGEGHSPADEKGGEGDCERRMVTDKRIGESELIEGDIVVVALGSKSVSALVGEFEGGGPELYTVGDCNL